MDLTSQKILVTGGAGFIGMNLVPRLVAAGATVRATLYQREPAPAAPGVEYLRGDLENAADCTRACAGMDLVVLAAANSSGAAVMATTPLVHLTPNLIMNARMLEAAYAAGVKKVLFLSSNTVYPLTDHAVAEGDAGFDFYDSYYVVGWMKRFSEIMCGMYSARIRTPMTTIVLRPGNIYGPHDKFDAKKSKVIAALIRRVVEGENPLNVWGDGRDIKDFIYVDDVVDAIVAALVKLETHTTLNIASGVPVTIRDVIAALLRIEGRTGTEVRYDATKPTMIPKRLIDIAAARAALGFAPRISLEEGLRRTIDWYRREGATQVSDA